MCTLWSALSSLHTQEYSERVKVTYQGHLERIQGKWLICRYVARKLHGFRSAWQRHRSVCRWCRNVVFPAVNMFTRFVIVLSRLRMYVISWASGLRTCGHTYTWKYEMYRSMLYRVHEMSIVKWICVFVAYFITGTAANFPCFIPNGWLDGWLVWVCTVEIGCVDRSYPIDLPPLLVA